MLNLWQLLSQWGLKVLNSGIKVAFSKGFFYNKQRKSDEKKSSKVNFTERSWWVQSFIETL